MNKTYRFNNNSPVFKTRLQAEAYRKTHNLDIIRTEKNDCYITHFCASGRSRFIYHIKQKLTKTLKR